MKRIITFQIMATPGLAANTAFANNWQWQLDQIKADQHRTQQHSTPAQPKLAIEKSTAAHNKAEATEANPIAIPPVK